MRVFAGMGGEKLSVALHLGDGNEDRVVLVVFGKAKVPLKFIERDWPLLFGYVGRDAPFEAVKMIGFRREIVLVGWLGPRKAGVVKWFLFNSLPC